MRILRPLVAGRADRYLEVCGQGGEFSGMVTEKPALPTTAPKQPRYLHLFEDELAWVEKNRR